LGGLLVILAQSGNICRRATKARHLLIKLRKIAAPGARLIKPFPHFRAVFLAAYAIKSRPLKRGPKVIICKYECKQQVSTKLEIKK